MQSPMISQQTTEVKTPASDSKKQLSSLQTLEAAFANLLSQLRVDNAPKMENDVVQRDDRPTLGGIDQVERDRPQSQAGPAQTFEPETQGAEPEMRDDGDAIVPGQPRVTDAEAEQRPQIAAAVGDAEAEASADDVEMKLTAQKPANVETQEAPVIEDEALPDPKLLRIPTPYSEISHVQVEAAQTEPENLQAAIDALPELDQALEDLAKDVAKLAQDIQSSADAEASGETVKPVAKIPVSSTALQLNTETEALTLPEAMPVQKPDEKPAVNLQQLQSTVVVAADAGAKLAGSMTDGGTGQGSHHTQGNLTDQALSAQKVGGAEFRMDAITQKEVTGVRQSEMIDRIAQVMRESSDQVKTRIRLSLNPPHLGKVDMDLTFKDGIIHASLKTETGEAKEILANGSSDLKTALAKLGITLGSFDVSQQGGHQQQQAFERQPGAFNRHAYGAYGGSSALEPASRASSLPGQGRSLDLVA